MRRCASRACTSGRNVVCSTLVQLVGFPELLQILLSLQDALLRSPLPIKWLCPQKSAYPTAADKPANDGIHIASPGPLPRYTAGLVHGLEAGRTLQKGKPQCLSNESYDARIVERRGLRRPDRAIREALPPAQPCAQSVSSRCPPAKQPSSVLCRSTIYRPSSAR